MCARLFRCSVLWLVLLAGCGGLLTDYEGTLCNPDGGCIEGYHCVAETGRCESGAPDAGETPDAGGCVNITACISNDGCCPQGCYANSDNDCAPVCGNSQLEPGELCDDGNTSLEDDCSTACKPNVCGDGFVDRQQPRLEACDDGNTVNETECPYGTRTCTGCGFSCLEVLRLTGRHCGDGTLNDPREQCDDGNASNEDDCPTTCKLATCGDGYVDGQSPRVEQCDTSGESASCNANCTVRVCGDGIVNTSAGEQCDNSGATNSTTCDGDCTVAFCGDRYLNSTRGEVCDTGGDSKNCDADCTPAACGDRFTNTAAGEACDDGNFTNETSCPYGTPSCTGCNTTCSAELHLTGPYCGDGASNVSEVCDDGNTTTETQCPYGTASCTRCNATCEGELSLTGPYCGDGTVTNTEVCGDGHRHHHHSDGYRHQGPRYLHHQ